MNLKLERVLIAFSRNYKEILNYNLHNLGFLSAEQKVVEMKRAKTILATTRNIFRLSLKKVETKLKYFQNDLTMFRCNEKTKKSY